MLSDIGLEKLDIIQINHPTNAKACCTEMFKFWLQVDVTASWNKLIEALRMIDKHHLAETIYRNILQGNSAYS